MRSDLVRDYLGTLPCKILGPYVEKWPFVGLCTLCMYISTDRVSSSKSDEVNLANKKTKLGLKSSTDGAKNQSIKSGCVLTRC